MTPREQLERMVKRYNFSHTELALHLGVSRAAVSHWLSGTREVPDSIKRMLEILGMIEALAPSMHWQLVLQSKYRAEVERSVRPVKTDH